MGFRNAVAGDRQRRAVGRGDLGPFLVVGAAGIVVADNLAVVRCAVRITDRGGMARAARGGADAGGFYCIVRLVPQRKPALSRQARREFRLTPERAHLRTRWTKSSSSSESTIARP